MRRATDDDLRPVRWQGSWRLLLALVLVLGLFSGGQPLANVARAASYDCDEAGLDAALAAGGAIAFTCPAASTITITTTKAITQDLILDGGGLLTISGDNTRQVFTVAAGVTATIRNLTITKGKATSGDGGGINNAGTLTLTGINLSDNNASGSNGAGVSNTGMLTVTNSSFSGNNATALEFNNIEVGGFGSLYNAGTMTVAGSDFYDNQASYAAAIGNGGTGTATITNTTVRNNNATIEGGAIFSAGGTLTVTNGTFYGNTAGDPGTSFYKGVAGAMTLQNSIIRATDTSASCTLGNGATFVDGGGNVNRGPGCGTTAETSLVNTDPLLSYFPADNGGPTATYLPNANSPALGLGVAAHCPLADQRGVARPAGANCTSGAVEGTTKAPDPMLTGLVSNPDPVVAGAGGTVTLTLTGTNFLQGITAVRIKGTAAVSGATTVNGGSIDVSVASPTELTATFPAFPTGTAGDYDVTVTDAPLATGDSAALTLTVLATAPSPTPSPSPTPTPTPTPSSSASPSPSPSPSSSPSASPSPSPVSAAVTASAQGSGTVTPAGVTSYTTGTLATYSASPLAGQIFLGWRLDGASAGFANPLDFTVNGDRTLIATFTPASTFSDVPGSGPAATAITELTARGIIKGYEDGTFGPADPLLRAQVAALLTRTLGWSAEAPSNTSPFNDLRLVDPELQRAVAILASRGIVGGYGDGIFGPADNVIHAQAISIIARSMVQAGRWTAVAQDNPAIYPDVPLSSGHRLDLLTFVQNAGALPDQPTTGMWTEWSQPAGRSWTAQVLWQAYASVFGVDRVP